MSFSDQITPAIDANPIIDSGTGVTGTSTSKDTSIGTIGQARTYARSDQQHPIQTENTISNSFSVDESQGSVDSYARNDHSHPNNVSTMLQLFLQQMGSEIMPEDLLQKFYAPTEIQLLQIISFQEHIQIVDGVRLCEFPYKN
ncbi:MAG: hypothetical protein EZS28_037177 [Streblomastix strix]|uniref:Uncharacterized protein n=1 Tax=Streblomastix strix TaxID=222440 RepID=A0A5J4U8R9_9EUKA|nr:MAG: hypothetical protein EZS28_037177 [Streblomastix strix]